jgi:hypothetical protein
MNPYEEYFSEHTPNRDEVLAAVRAVTKPTSTHVISIAVCLGLEWLRQPEESRRYDEPRIVVLPTEEAAVLDLLEELERSGLIRGLGPDEWRALGLYLGGTDGAKLWWTTARWDFAVRKSKAPGYTVRPFLSEKDRAEEEARRYSPVRDAVDRALEAQRLRQKNRNPFEGPQGG